MLSNPCPFHNIVKILKSYTRKVYISYHKKPVSGYLQIPYELVTKPQNGSTAHTAQQKLKEVQKRS